MFKFTRDDIKKEVDSGSYIRGIGYFQQAMVEKLDVERIDDDLVVLYATVKGSGNAIYSQEIDISRLLDGSIDINGECSCPVGFNCKHVVAACLEYHFNPGAKGNDQSDASLFWLHQFVNAGLTSEPPDMAGTEFIAYILKLAHQSTELTVEFMVCRHLKKGGIGKGRRTDLHNFSNDYSNPGYAQDSDKEIGKLIEVQNNNMWGGYRNITLSGELGFLALSKILNTGRCYWQDTRSPALQSGAPRELQLNWHEEKNGDRRLDINVTPAAILLNTQPALYLDFGVGIIGSIEGADFNAEQWNMLLQAPVVPAKASVEFSQQVLTLLPGIPLPPTQEIKILHIEQETPIPNLTLYSNSDPANGQRIHMMRLRFVYAGYELTPSPPVPVRNIVTDEQVVCIQRDLSAEKIAMGKLFDAGFQGVAEEQYGDVVFITPDESGLMASAACWQNFLEEVLPELEARGWQVERNEDFQLQFLHADDWEVEIETDNEWFDLRFDLDIQGHKLPLLPLIAEVLNNYELDQLPEILLVPLPAFMGESQFLQLPSERIRPICQILYELYDSSALADDGSLRMNRFDAPRLADLEENTELNWRGGKAMRALGRKLKNFKGIKKVAVPRGLKTTLRDYQQQGLNWLQFLRSYEFNGILADDMGLGKTVQTLAHLLKEKEAGRMDKPCLILAPTSLMSNWRREAEQFTPKLKVLILQGSQRKQHFDKIEQYDLILSTYPLMVRDHEILLAHDYYYLILDEAQVIKNPRAKAARMVRDVRCSHRLCLTGTPMENHLGELWALFDFLMPGFLATNKQFTQRFRTPIEKFGDLEQRQRLVRRIAPFMLRRGKAEVLKELPAKTEILRSVALDTKQAALYESIRLSMEKKVRDAIKQKGLARSHITILDALLKLRQTCCDPQLLSLPQAKKVKSSAKLEMLMEMLPEMLEEGRRILLFSQFTKMLAIIEERLKEQGISYTKLTGQTRKRDEVIESFRQGEVDVFLISLKAGGVGLNLTEADTVIHYDPWWNPAVENQATDRAHRIGQNKAVFVYKLIIENTLEEKIMAMQARKQALADGVYDKEHSGKDVKLTADDLQELFAPLSDKSG